MPDMPNVAKITGYITTPSMQTSVVKNLNIQYGTSIFQVE